MPYLMDRLRELLTRHKRHDLLGFDVREVRGQIDEDRARKEAELEDIANFESELDGIEADAAEAADPDSSSDGDDNANKE